MAANLSLNVEATAGFRGNSPAQPSAQRTGFNARHYGAAFRNWGAWQGSLRIARSGMGLRPYSAAEVRTSSWIRSLEHRNRVHPSHRPESFERYRHFILAFHDTTFECVAESFDVQLHRGTPLSALIAGLSKFDPLAWRHGER